MTGETLTFMFAWMGRVFLACLTGLFVKNVKKCTKEFVQIA
ncbi:hypothetical protein C818_02331 [Lachnospiraceae bacterium MD308]|nr:hypothetical protein C818_02331 [Lachnospiraceae bacterium MD308]